MSTIYILYFRHPCNWCCAHVRKHLSPTILKDPNAPKDFNDPNDFNDFKVIKEEISQNQIPPPRHSERPRVIPSEPASFSASPRHSERSEESENRLPKTDPSLTLRMTEHDRSFADAQDDWYGRCFANAQHDDLKDPKDFNDFKVIKVFKEKLLQNR